MAITNRSLDSSQQNLVLESSYGAVATGSTLFVGVVPANSTLQKCLLSATGLSASPAYALRILRFIVGTGITTINPTNNTGVPPEFGTSGSISMSLLAAGNTLLTLLAGDVMTLTSSVSNSAVTNLAVAIVIKETQDIVSTLGIT